MVAVKIVLYFLIFGALFGFVYGLIAYIREYRLLQLLWARITKDIEARNKIRRESVIKKARMAMESLDEVEYSIMERVYQKIDQCGILKVLPGFNETAVLFLTVMLLAILFIVIASLRDAAVAAAVVVTLVILLNNACNVAIHRRKEKLELEMFSFINACQCSASTHPDIISIFEDIYDDMNEPLATMLEECVLKANSNEMTKHDCLKELRQNSPSKRFYAIINNLEVCSDTNGDYVGVINDLRETVRIYHTSLEKRKSLLRNARINVLIMAALGIFILRACNGFVDGFTDILIGSTAGIILLIVLVLVLILGLTINID